MNLCTTIFSCYCNNGNNGSHDFQWNFDNVFPSMPYHLGGSLGWLRMNFYLRITRRSSHIMLQVNFLCYNVCLFIETKSLPVSPLLFLNYAGRLLLLCWQNIATFHPRTHTSTHSFPFILGFKGIESVFSFSTKSMVQLMNDRG